VVEAGIRRERPQERAAQRGRQARKRRRSARRSAAALASAAVVAVAVVAVAVVAGSSSIFVAERILPTPTNTNNSALLVSPPHTAARAPPRTHAPESKKNPRGKLPLSKVSSSPPSPTNPSSRVNPSGPRSDGKEAPGQRAQAPGARPAHQEGGQGQGHERDGQQQKACCCCSCSPASSSFVRLEKEGRRIGDQDGRRHPRRRAYRPPRARLRRW
jgi:hypothetical protein